MGLYKLSSIAGCPLSLLLGLRILDTYTALSTYCRIVDCVRFIANEFVNHVTLEWACCCWLLLQSPDGAAVMSPPPYFVSANVMPPSHSQYPDDLDDDETDWDRLLWRPRFIDCPSITLWSIRPSVCPLLCSECSLYRRYRIVAMQICISPYIPPSCG